MDRQGQTNLRASCVPQVIRPIDLEPKMIVGVDHLVGHGVFQVPLILHLVGAEEDAILGIKATRFAIRTTTAVDIVTRQVASQLTDIIAQKADYRTCMAQMHLVTFPWDAQPAIGIILHCSR